MVLTPEQKHANKRNKMIETAAEYQLGSYARRFVASCLQQVIRAEAGADPRPFVTAVVNGELTQVARSSGFCACVTCGTVLPWKNSSATHGRLDSGHFLASRRMSILFEESGINPQCVSCNQHLSGNQGCYTTWMRFMYGQDEIDRLRKLKNTTVQFTREELVDMRLAYQARLETAIKLMESPQ